MLLALVNDILDLSKVEAGRLELEAVEFDPRDLLERAVGLVRGRADQKGLTVSVAVDEGSPSGSSETPCGSSRCSSTCCRTG